MKTEPDWRDVDTREGYDRWAATYDGEANPLIALEEPLVDRVLGDVAGLDLLDLGTGTGRHAIRLAAAGARVIAVDFSEQMLAKARAKPGAERVRFENHDVTRRLPFGEASFDRVLSALVLEHVVDLVGFFGELGRLTRRDGRIVVTAMHPAMFLRGVSARFRDEETGEFLRPRSYALQLSDYIMGALNADLRILALTEHSPDDALAARVPRAAKYVGWPMLFVMELATWSRDYSVRKTMRGRPLRRPMT
jgi:malonyl-CoA O-methyltransferase